MVGLARQRMRDRSAVAVLFSTHHPAMDWQLHSRDDYFAVRQVTETWQCRDHAGAYILISRFVI